MGYAGLAFNLAMAIGPVIGLAIMGEGRFKLMFYSAFIVALVGSIVLFGVNFPEFKRPDGLKFSWNGLITKRALPVTLNVLIVMLTFGGLVTFLTLYAEEQDLTAFTGLYFTIMAVGMGLARVFGGQIFDRLRFSAQ